MRTVPCLYIGSLVTFSLACQDRSVGWVGVQSKSGQVGPDRVILKFEEENRDHLGRLEVEKMERLRGTSLQTEKAQSIQAPDCGRAVLAPDAASGVCTRRNVGGIITAGNHEGINF